MVRHNARKKKVWRKKFANIAAISRLKSVKNTTKSISEVVNHKRYGEEIPKDKLITNPYTGHQFVMTNPHPIYGEKYGIVVTGHDWIPVEEYKASSGLLWEHKKYPQPKNLHKKQKYWYKTRKMSPEEQKEQGSITEFAIRHLVSRKSEYPDYTPHKMNKVQYMEKLVEHKLNKWERKYPKPSDELFNDIEQWKQDRETALERLRDFVVSIYDKLEVTATIQTPGGPPYKDIVIGTVKDTGDESKTVEMAKGVVKHAKTIHKNILHAQLLNHKKNSYRLLAA